MHETVGHLPPFAAHTTASQRTSVTPRMGSRGASGIWSNQPLFQKPGGGAERAVKEGELAAAADGGGQSWAVAGQCGCLRCCKRAKAMQQAIATSWRAVEVHNKQAKARRKPGSGLQSSAMHACKSTFVVILQRPRAPGARLAKLRANRPCAPSRGTATCRTRPCIVAETWEDSLALPTCVQGCRRSMGAAPTAGGRRADREVKCDSHSWSAR